MASRIVLAYDLGGTKLAAGIVNERGRVLESVRVPVRVEDGVVGVADQLASVGRELLKAHPRAKRAAIASAGPLDPRRVVLLDPTNLHSGKGWGEAPLAAPLARKLKIPVKLENDAAAAILAERWVGSAKRHPNAMVLTLGTGLGTGIVANGELVRCGHGLHPEAGHVILRAGDASAPCGCGNVGCAEAYLSGRNFARRVAARWREPDLKAETIATRARDGDPRAREAFDEYAENFAVAVQDYAVIWAPEIVVLAGSFAAAADLFVPQALERLEILLARRRVGVDYLPKIEVSKLENNSGLVGAAWVALNGSAY